jgi:hypothetical protein
VFFRLGVVMAEIVPSSYALRKTTGLHKQWKVKAIRLRLEYQRRTVFLYLSSTLSMGCDIHARAEMQMRINRNHDQFHNDTWEKVGHVFGNRWYRSEGDPTDYNSPYTDKPIDLRNYEVFTALANVREADGITPISEPRGIPEDASYEYRELAENDGDAHSESWVTLAELKAYDTSAFDDVTKEIWQTLIENLESVKHGRSDDQVRMVFYFDN